MDSCGAPLCGLAHLFSGSLSASSHIQNRGDGRTIVRRIAHVVKLNSAIGGYQDITADLAKVTPWLWNPAAFPKDQLQIVPHRSRPINRPPADTIHPIGSIQRSLRIHNQRPRQLGFLDVALRHHHAIERYDNHVDVQGC